MKNKKGNIFGILFFILMLFVILFLGFIFVVGSSVINYVFDETIPELTTLGIVGDANMTDIASYTVTPLNNIIQMGTWILGVVYVMFLIGSIALAFIIRESPNKWLIGFYLVLVLMLIMGSILISNIYEEFYNGTDELAIRLKEHTLLSFMVLQSPAVFTVICFISGAIMFSGMQSEEVGV